MLNYLVVGALTGWVVGRIMKTGNLILADAAVGAVGALAVRYLMSVIVETASTGWWMIAIAGGAVPLGILRLVRQR